MIPRWRILKNYGLKIKWDKVFKNGPSKIFKGCLPQISLGPFLNTLSQITVYWSLTFGTIKNNIRRPQRGNWHGADACEHVCFYFLCLFPNKKMLLLPKQIFMTSELTFSWPKLLAEKSSTLSESQKERITTEFDKSLLC